MTKKLGIYSKNKRPLRDGIKGFFASGFFHEAVSPHAAPEYPIRHFEFFRIISGDIRMFKGAQV